MKAKSKLHWLIVGLSLLTLAALAGCRSKMVMGSGNVVTREFEFSDFDAVSIGYTFGGTITQGDDYRVVVHIDDNLERYLQVEQSGGRLNIGLDNVVGSGVGTLTYEITLPSLTTLEMDGASQARLSGLSIAEALTAKANGASRIEGDVTAGELTVVANGASTIILSGSGGDVHAAAEGISTVDLTAFAASNADVTASGVSTVIVNADGQLDAEADGPSNVYYLGYPTLGNINASGGADVERRW